MYVVFTGSPTVVDVGRERQLLDERAVLRLCLAKALFVLVALRDVAERDRKQQRPGHVDAGDRELGRERPAVGAERVDLEARAEQRAAGRRGRRRAHRGRRARRRARGTACRPRRRASSRTSPPSRCLPRRSALRGRRSRRRRARRGGSRLCAPRSRASIRSERLRCGHVDHRRDHADDLPVRVADRRRRDDWRRSATRRGGSLRTSRSRTVSPAAMRSSVSKNDGSSSSGTIGLRRPIASSAVQPKISAAPPFHDADTAVEVEVDDRSRRGVDQRAVVLVRVLDLLELRRVLERGRRLVRERPQDLQPLGVGPQPVGRVVGPDVADAPAAPVVQRDEQPVVLPRVRAAAVALRVVARRAGRGAPRAPPRAG